MIDFTDILLAVNENSPNDVLMFDLKRMSDQY